MAVTVALRDFPSQYYGNRWYDIEERAKAYSVAQREQLRSRESAPILDSIFKWLASPVVAQVLPKSDFGEALRYLRNPWSALNVYVGDGRIPIDNSLVEQLMKQLRWAGRRGCLYRVLPAVSGARR